MTAQTSRRNSTIVVAIAILFLLLVGLPIGSWYYLRTGLEYRKEVMADLDDLGKVPSISLKTFSGKTLDNQNIAKKMVITSFLNFQNKEITKQSGAWLQRLHDQFDERSDLAFLIHVVDTSATSEEVERFAQQYQLQDSAQCFFLKDNPEVFRTIATNVYKIPLEEIDQHFALTDTSGTVRQKYNITNNNEVKRLVEHTALLLPKGKERTSTSIKRKQTEQ